MYNLAPTEFATFTDTILESFTQISYVVSTCMVKHLQSSSTGRISKTSYFEKGVREGQAWEEGWLERG